MLIRALQRLSYVGVHPNSWEKHQYHMHFHLTNERKNHFMDACDMNPFEKHIKMLHIFFGENLHLLALNYLCVFMHVCVLSRDSWSRSEGSLQELVFSLCYMGFRDQTQVIETWGQLLYPLRNRVIF